MATDVELLIRDNNSLFLISVYVNPKLKVSTKCWDNFISNLPTPFLMGGDFNAHHSNLANSFNDSKGMELMRSIENNNVCIVNYGQHILMNGWNRDSTAVDITLCSPSVSTVFNWNRCDDLLGSNHYPMKVCSLHVSVEIVQTIEAKSGI